MDMQAYIDEIKFKLTGDVLETELEDKDYIRAINSAFREVQRYINSTKIVTVPYKDCIDMSDVNPSAVTAIYRTRGYYKANGSSDSSNVPEDPLYMSQWQMLSGLGQGHSMSDWAYNYAAWNTSAQIRNSLSTDLQFRFDKHDNLLYISTSFDRPTNITIEYIPRYDSVSEVVSDYWIDILIRMATALVKIVTGRIRTRYSQDNAVWKQDGEKLLEEGNTELEALRENLRVNNNLCYPID